MGAPRTSVSPAGFQSPRSTARGRGGGGGSICPCALGRRKKIRGEKGETEAEKTRNELVRDAECKNKGKVMQRDEKR